MPHYYINSNDLWFNLNESIYDIFNYIDEAINAERYAKWTKVYSKWQTKQLQLNKFDWYLDHIAEAIVNNWYFNLEPFELTLEQEAIIQHVLIYNYGLTIKGWGLVKFPNNTQDLHLLLEPNFHTLTEY